MTEAQEAGALWPAGLYACRPHKFNSDVGEWRVRLLKSSRTAERCADIYGASELEAQARARSVAGIREAQRRIKAAIKAMFSSNLEEDDLTDIAAAELNAEDELRAALRALSGQGESDA